MKAQDPEFRTLYDELGPGIRRHLTRLVGDSEASHAGGVVDRLPPVHRAVILLGELRDSSDREIADALGITLEAAKMRLHRARGELRKLLQAGCDIYRDERNELACDRKPPAGPDWRES